MFRHWLGIRSGPRVMSRRVLIGALIGTMLLGSAVSLAQAPVSEDQMFASKNIARTTAVVGSSGSAMALAPDALSKNYGDEARMEATSSDAADVTLKNDAAGQTETFGAPLPGSKNWAEPSVEAAQSAKNTVQKTAVEGAADVSLADVVALATKNMAGEASSVSPDDLGASLAASGVLVAGGASGNMDWTTTSATFQVIRQCTLSVPQGGWVFISADGSVARRDGEYEGQFRIDIDSTAGDLNIDRWVNVYNDSGDGTDESVALSVLKPISAGTHTFYFLGRRLGGAGTMLVYDPTLSVVYIPGADSDVLAAGVSGNMDWTTTSGTFQVIRQVTLNVPRAGQVFLSANGSAARRDGEYEAVYEIGIDSTTGDQNIDGWVNVYNDTGDGTDRSVALSVLKPISAGAHTFYFLGKRHAGTATVLTYDPTLSVMYLPSNGVNAVANGISGNLDWTTTSGSFQVIRQCTLSVPKKGWVFISVDSSLARQAGDYEASLEIGIDSTVGDQNIDRWVNIYADTGDGTDKSVSLTVLKQVSPGLHTFYFLGRRYAGTGTMLLYDPTLTVIAPGGQTFIPFTTK